MKWEGEFRVPGTPEAVIVEFADARRMAAHLPGAAVETVEDDGTISGSLTVKFGPKRLVFKGLAKCDVDLEALRGSISGRGAADMRAAQFKVTLNWSLRADAGTTEPMTIVTLASEAALQGVLADFARTGGPIVAQALTEEFATRLRIDLTARRDGLETAPAEGGTALSAGILARKVAGQSLKNAGRTLAGYFKDNKQDVSS